MTGVASPGRRARLEFAADYVCPWCYLATPLIDRAARRLELEVRWLHVPLLPDAPSEGVRTVDLFAARADELPAMRRRMRRLTASAGLAYVDRDRISSSRLAHELAAWAAGVDGRHAIHRELFHSTFALGLDIGDVEVLVDAAERAGLSGADARRALASGAGRAAAERHHRRARRLGIRVVPTVIVGEERLSGHVEAVDLDALFARHRPRIADVPVRSPSPVAPSGGSSA